MKDAYSFDRDEDGLDASFAAMETAYRRIFDRCGLDFRKVEAHSGEIGGKVSNEFHVLASSGEDAIVACSKCDYAANIEKAEVARAKSSSDEQPIDLEEIATPGTRTVDEVTALLDVSPDRLVKTLIIEVDDSQPTAVLIRGDHQLSEVKLTLALGGQPWRFATDQEIQERTGGPQGFSGPIGLQDVRIIADQSVEFATNVVVGANRVDSHYRNANPGRDFQPERYLDLRNARGGEPCPRCQEPQTIMRGIEVGHIFKLGTTYSESMRATFLDQDGKEKPFAMGCYGLGIGRTVAAAIEQNHDDDGIIWPAALAPYDVVVTIVNQKDDEVVGAANRLTDELEALGLAVLLDDRAERPGVKFKDADLIGIPLRAVCSNRNLANGKIELSTRRDREKILVDVSEAAAHVATMR